MKYSGRIRETHLIRSQNYIQFDQRNTSDTNHETQWGESEKLSLSGTGKSVDVSLKSRGKPKMSTILTNKKDTVDKIIEI